MKVGLILPTFLENPDITFETALSAEDLGLDGVFVYDHMWPIGHPNQPAISALVILASLTQITKKVRLGTLVSRVGLVSDHLLFSDMVTLDTLSANRLIAGLGTGDKKSVIENQLLHIKKLSIPERQNSLAKIALQLSKMGVETWIGAGLDSTNKIALQSLAKLNFWDISPEALQEKINTYDYRVVIENSPEDMYSEILTDPRGDKLPFAANAGNFTWAGHFPEDRREAATIYRALSSLGISWAVFYVKYSKKERFQGALSLLCEMKQKIG